jgi:hypothetical protein
MKIFSLSEEEQKIVNDLEGLLQAKKLKLWRIRLPQRMKKQSAHSALSSLKIKKGRKPNEGVSMTGEHCKWISTCQFSQIRLSAAL